MGGGLSVPPFPAPVVSVFSAPVASEPRTLWQAEQLRTVFEHSRVRRIGRAQDALSLVEEKVYDLLWGPRNLQRDEFRLVHCSLQRVANEARINIKTVRELIPRLIDKGFIAIEHLADPRHNTATLYRVWSYSSVLARQRARNRFYVVKTGKGVFYVHPVAAALTPSEALGVDTRPMGLTPGGYVAEPLVDEAHPEGAAPMDPMGAGAIKPMGAGGSLSKESFKGSSLRHTSPAAYASLVQTIRTHLGAEPDSALLEGMIAECQERAIETTGEPASDEELLYFAQSKARVLAGARNIRNHLAVLRKALPECFSGEAFRVFREAGGRRAQSAEVAETAESAVEANAEAVEWAAVCERHRDGRGYDMQAIAEDAQLNEKGRRIAREMVRRLGRFTTIGLVI